MQRIFLVKFFHQPIITEVYFLSPFFFIHFAASFDQAYPTDRTALVVPLFTVLASKYYIHRFQPHVHRILPFAHYYCSCFSSFRLRLSQFYHPVPPPMLPSAQIPPSSRLLHLALTLTLLSNHGVVAGEWLG